MGKKPKLNFEVVMTYIWQMGNCAQKNSDSLCGVFNSDRNQIKSRSLHKRKPPPFKLKL